MNALPTLLTALPATWAGLDKTRLTDGTVRLIRHGRDAYDPAEIDYVLSFRPPAGLIKSLPNVRAVFSMAAGVDGFLARGDYPQNVPLFRFVDPTLSAEMAQYLLMEVLSFHRGIDAFREGQKKCEWRQRTLPRRTEETRIGILGLGKIGGFVGGRFAELGFPVSGWSRHPKSLPHIESYAGPEELSDFFRHSDILICLLPLTAETRGILNAAAFAALPEGALVINVARGGHVVNEDLIAALGSGHLAHAVLDVFDVEPLPADSPLWRHPKITVTPHIASISQPAVAAASVIDGICRFERGEMPPNRVDIEAGY